MIVVLGIAGMAFGWFVYSKFIATKIYQLDPDFVTPAHEFNDGVDYHPTNKYVLWGHHFTSVAGAAPIVGPAIAVYWGWVPAVLWVTIGTIFFAGVHDFGAIWASARHQGKSIGALSEEIIGKRTRALFMSSVSRHSMAPSWSVATCHSSSPIHCLDSLQTLTGSSYSLYMRP
jgi:carbon starvation protein